MVTPSPHSALLLLGALLVLVSCRAESPRPDLETVERAFERPSHGPAPDFTLSTLERDSFTLSAHQGQILILNFWATWCAPCIIEVPELMAIQDSLGEEGVLVVGISQDTGPNAFSEVRDFHERFRVNYPLVLDMDLAVARSYGVYSLPTTVIVDQQGQIHKRRVGLLKQDDVLQMMDGLMDDRTALHVIDSMTEPANVEPLRPTTHVASITVEEAAALFEAGVMVVDLRDDAERDREGQIPAALAITADDLDVSDLPANLAAPVVFIAGTDSVAVGSAARAAHWGYRSAYPVQGGFQAWRAAGLPVEAGLRKL